MNNRTTDPKAKDYRGNLGSKRFLEFYMLYTDKCMKSEANALKKVTFTKPGKNPFEIKPHTERGRKAKREKREGGEGRNRQTAECKDWIEKGKNNCYRR